jgi:hypothetical protein
MLRPTAHRNKVAAEGRVGDVGEGDVPRGDDPGDGDVAGDPDERRQRHSELRGHYQ